MWTAHFAKGGALRRLLILITLFCCVKPANAQRLSSYGVAAGAAVQNDARATAVFSLSAGVHWLVPWLAMLHRSVADLEGDSGVGTLRDVSLALLPSWEPWGGRLLFAVGPSVHALRRDLVLASDDDHTRIALTGVTGVRLPLAGEGVLIELLARADALDPQPQYVAILGVRVRPGLPNTLMLGEPRAPARIAEHAAVWNDVLMQVILLQQNLESFTRIKEIETGIELEFDQSVITLYDDIATVARVLAAADPPVLVTVFAPNAGRAGAAVTAGAFPAERLRLQRDTRVYLRVEH
jgi:hypothetical protein